MFRCAAIAIALIAVAAAVPAAPAAEPAFSVSQSPDAVAFPGSSEIAFRLSMTGGSAESRFRVDVRAPTYGRGLRAEGSPLGPAHGSDRVELSGDARMEDLTSFEALPACSPEENLFHGAEPESYRTELVLPAGGRAVLTVRYRFGGFAPWPGMRLAPIFAIGSRRFQSWGPRLRARRTGVRIDLRTTPASAPRPGADADTPSVPLGRAIRIRGRTEPRLAGHWISLRTGHRPADAFARVRTNSRGRFSYWWRPPRRGGYSLWAFYRSQASHVLSDHACPRAITVR